MPRDTRLCRPALAVTGVLVLALGACGGDRVSGPSDLELGLLEVSYVCGRRFELENGNAAATTVRYEVVGSGESGDLTLPAAAGTTASRTRLVTLGTGTVRVSYRGTRIGEAANTGSACPPPNPAPPEPQATMGEWGSVFEWPIVAVHQHLLPSGKVLSWGRGERGDPPYLWDPLSGLFTAVPVSTDVFCAGHSFLPDGRLLVTGGHQADHEGLADANLFDPTTERWTSLPAMAYARWYPTNTTLPDGRVLTIAGADQDAVMVEIPEVWDGTRWHELPGAQRELPYYPRMFVAPNGLVFYAGDLPETGYLDPSGQGSWQPVATSHYGQRDYGSAVMYEPGKVLIVGGSDPPEGPPTNTAEVIDLNDAAPRWSYTGSMAYARRQLNVTLLPDGTVLATGGTSAGGLSDASGAVHAAELWSPATGQWTTLAANPVTRVYHSTALLLPDGRVLHAGSGDAYGVHDELNAEIFTPPYLFRGERPEVSSAPSSVGYGQTFFVATPDAGAVTRVSWIRLSSVTHAFNQDQRFDELTFTRSPGGISAVAPASPNLAPPGPYMLFLLSDEGVPSMARIIRIG